MKLAYFLLGAICLPVNAEVLSTAPNGFVIHLETTVKVDATTAYQQFLNVADWWDAAHTYYGKSENLSIDAVAGGCFCETFGENQVLHMTVSYVEPGREVRMTGGLGPLQMLGVHGGMSWKFEELENGVTKITHRYQVSGYVDGGLDKFAKFVNKVQAGQLEQLRQKLAGNEFTQ